MSEKFVSNPKEIQLNLQGVNGTTYAYEWIYDTTNNKWEHTGMYRDSMYGFVPSGSVHYIEPINKYSVQNGIIEGNIEKCSNDADFPMYDLDLDMFLINRFHNGTDQKDFNHTVCDTTLPSGASSYYIINSLNYSPDNMRPYAGEYENNKHGIGWGVTLNNNSISTQSVMYSRPYKLDPNLYAYEIGAGDDTWSVFRISCNIYNNWEKFIASIINNTSLCTKYNIDTSNGTLKLSNDSNLANCVKYTFGIIDNNFGPLNFNIIYRAEITVPGHNNISIIKHNLTSNVVLENFDYYNGSYYTEEDLDNLDNFNKIIEVFTGSNGVCTTGTDTVYMDESVTGYTTTSVELYFSSLSNNENLNANCTKPIHENTWFDMFNKTDLQINGNLYNEYNINVKFAIIQEQNNYENNTIIKRYICKIIEKNMTININSSKIGFTDFPISKYENLYSLPYPNGLFNTFVVDNVNKFNSGVVYSLYKENDIYYNYTLNKQAICNGTDPLDWTDIQS